jgi:hypothetical protein
VTSPHSHSQVMWRPAAAGDRADQHSPGPQPMAAGTCFGWLDHPLTASADQLAHGSHGINATTVLGLVRWVEVASKRADTSCSAAVGGRA